MDEIQIYIGKLVNIDNNKIKDDEWSELIDMAEKLLIRYCSPPYNSSGINKKFKIETEDNDKEASPDYILLNYNRKGVIPYEVSTLHDRLDLFGNNDYETLKYIQL